MMVRAIFFASLREAVETEFLDVEIGEGAGLRDLRQGLAARLGADQMAALYAPEVRVAINRRLLHDGEGSALVAGDEVAFMPPVTGG